MAQIKVDYIDHMGTDLSVVNAARVSFNKDSDWEYACVADCAEHGFRPDETCTMCENMGLGDKDKKLINYLADNKHTSPFGHCFASFRVKAPIFVARQLVKHKFLRWNEVSRRYVDEEPEFYTPNAWRKRAKHIKQGSSGSVSEDDSWSLDENYEYLKNRATALYNLLLEREVAPEMARMVLPQSTMTEWWWSGSLDAWADMCRLRLDDHAQMETQEVAEQINRYMDEAFPISWRCLMGEYGRDV